MSVIEEKKAMAAKDLAMKKDDFKQGRLLGVSLVNKVCMRQKSRTSI
jgi:hypothetical protein